MFHALVILLHRPFLSDGHLQSIVGSTATAAFTLCSEAADGIAKVLDIYGQHFCFKTCPYFLSWATYVSGTVHVRIAAQSTSGSRAHLALWSCLDILEEQQARCHAPRQSMKILLGLVERLGVEPRRHYEVQLSRSEAIGNSQNSSLAHVSADSQQMDGCPALQGRVPDGVDFTTKLDIDAVIESFNFTSAAANTSASLEANNVPSGANTSSIDYSDMGLGKVGEDYHAEHVQHENYEELFDPLFGIDALLPDTSWIHTGIEPQ